MPLQDFTLPPNVKATTSAAEAIQGARYAVHAVPVQHSRAFLSGIRDVLPPNVSLRHHMLEHAQAGVRILVLIAVVLLGNLLMHAPCISTQKHASHSRCKLLPAQHILLCWSSS